MTAGRRHIVRTQGST